MRRRPWPPRAISVLLALAAAACGPAGSRYRFASPQFASARLPAAPLVPDAAVARQPRPPLGNHAVAARPLRVVAPVVHEPAASAAAAAAIRSEPAAQPTAWSRLPARHRVTPAQPLLHAASDLRDLVGRRDRREPSAAALDWARELGSACEATTGPELIAWAGAARRAALPAPGDLLVFDRVEGAPADLVAVVVATDDRGVIELVYLGGGVVRRGFADPRRPGTRRDPSGGVVNTFLRTGKRWPPHGTHYLAGELLATIVRAR